jgi:hypothetical protein
VSESEIISKEDIRLVLPERKVGRKSKEQQEQYLLQRKTFADMMKKYSKLIGMKISSRGWCYIAEGDGLINKGDFDSFQDLINECRKEGDLPIDFVKIDDSRRFENVEDLTNEPMSPEQYVKEKVLDENLKNHWNWKDDVAFWETQDSYLQMMVEKIDVKTLFQPVCANFRVPIANARGWSDIHERADFIGRFKEAHDLKKRCILLYFGDFDPAGILIAEKLKKNIDDLAKATGFDSSEIQIDHFGLSFDFIKENNLLWIDNLETGGKDDAGNAKHANEKLAYVREYVAKYGRRKCEANAILKIREIGKKLCRDAITKYIDFPALEKYNAAIREERKKVKEVYEKLGIFKQIEEWTNVLDEVLEEKENNSSQEVNSPEAIESEEIEEGGTQDLEPENFDQVPTDQPLEEAQKKYVMMFLKCPECHQSGFYQVFYEDAVEISQELLIRYKEKLLEKRKNTEKGKRRFVDLSPFDLNYECLHCRIFNSELDAILEKYDIFSWSLMEDEFLERCEQIYIPPSGWERVVKIYLEWRKSIHPEEETDIDDSPYSDNDEPMYGERCR